MDQLFDLDGLHKKQNRQRRLKIGIGCIVLVTVVITVMGLLGNRRTSSQLIATASYNANSTSGDTTSDPSINTTLPSSDLSSLNRQIAQEQAQAAQDEANAEKDIADAQNAQTPQTPLDSALPPASSSVNPVTLPTIPVTSPSSTCTIPSNLNALATQYTQAESALNSFEANPSAYVSMYGLNASGLQAQEQQKFASLETAATNAYNAYATAEAQVHC